MSTVSDSQSVLTFVRDGAVTEHPLVNARILIGRADGCEICFPFNQEISRLHASLSETGEGWQIEDVTSRSGTYVNGERVLEPQLLQDNDVILIGKVELLFRTKKHSAETVFGTVDIADLAQRAQQRPPTPAAASIQTEDTVPALPPEPTPPPITRRVNLPNHYEVLRLPNFESDLAEIDRVAKQRLRQLREEEGAGTAGGEASEYEAVTAAMICLTNRRRKREYDQQLADWLGIEYHVSGDRLIPRLNTHGSEAAFLILGIVVLGLIAWFATPVVIQSVQKFFSDVQQSIPGAPR